MKKKCFWSGFFAVVLIAAVAAAGCKGPAGPAGSTGATGPVGSGYVMQFQDGAYPAASYTGASDTGLDSLNSTTNYSDFTTFSIGYSPSPAEKDRYIIKYNLSSVIPGNVNVTAAYFTIVVDAVNGSNSLLIYPLTTPFTAAGATWEDSAASTPWTTPGGDFSPVPQSNTVTVSTFGTYTFTLNTAMVQNWITNPSMNDGMIVIATNESSGNNVVDLWYDEYATVADRPMLTVYYTLPLN